MTNKDKRLAVLICHPVQYYAPIFRELASHFDLHVFYGQRLSPSQQAKAGFGVEFDWDVDLFSGYASSFLNNVSRRPGPDHFLGCDTPEIGRLLKQGRFHALLVIGWYLKCFVQATWAAKRLGLPVLVRGDSHLDMPIGHGKQIAKQAFFPIALRAFDAALYVGERSREYYLHYGYPEKRLFFSPHCVDNEWFAARATGAARQALRSLHGISSDDKVALFAGKLVPFKRPLDLVFAAGILKSQGFDLTVLVAGAGQLAEQMRTSAQSAGVRLIELGFCNQTQMPAALAAADVLVLPSGGEETWGLVANEALASGVPIVVSDRCGCALDLAGDGRVGRIFPVGNIQALASALRTIIQNPPSHEAIASKVASYGIAAATDGIEAAVHSVVNTGRAWQ